MSTPRRRQQKRWDIETVFGLPILWSFVALMLAMMIPPPGLEHQLKPVYHHSPRIGLEAGGEGRTAMILTAHPDDEAMFFSPTILGLKNHGWEVWGLCLSTGDAEGLGIERIQELKRSYGVLGVDEKHVEVLDLPSLPDGMNTVWDPKVVQKVVDEYLVKKPVDIIITFDQHGVSQHPNHVALSSYRPRPISPKSHTKLYHLSSPSQFIKYTGALNPVLRRGWYQLAKGMREWADVFDMVPSVDPDWSITSAGTDWIKSIRAMREHKTQMVWYRYGWLMTGGMMWVNDLKSVV